MNTFVIYFVFTNQYKFKFKFVKSCLTVLGSESFITILVSNELQVCYRYKLNYDVVIDQMFMNRIFFFSINPI